MRWVDVCSGMTVKKKRKRTAEQNSPSYFSFSFSIPSATFFIPFVDFEAVALGNPNFHLPVYKGSTISLRASYLIIGAHTLMRLNRKYNHLREDPTWVIKSFHGSHRTAPDTFFFVTNDSEAIIPLNWACRLNLDFVVSCTFCYAATRKGWGR